jgi:hypothetical protein
MPMSPQTEQVQNSLRGALLHRGFRPGANGVMRVPLLQMPNTDGEVRALRRPGARWVELAPGEDHMLSDDAWRALTAPAGDPFADYRDL